MIEWLSLISFLHIENQYWDCCSLSAPDRIKCFLQWPLLPSYCLCRVSRVCRSFLYIKMRHTTLDDKLSPPHTHAGTDTHTEDRGHLLSNNIPRHTVLKTGIWLTVHHWETTGKLRRFFVSQTRTHTHIFVQVRFAFHVSDCLHEQFSSPQWDLVPPC